MSDPKHPHELSPVVHPVIASMTPEQREALRVHVTHAAWQAGNLSWKFHATQQRIYDAINASESKQFYLLLNQIAARGEIAVETVAPADEDVNSLYQYLIGSGSDGGLV